MESVTYLDLRCVERVILSLLKADKKHISASLLSKTMNWDIKRASEALRDFTLQTKFLQFMLITFCGKCEKENDLTKLCYHKIKDSGTSNFDVETFCKECGNELKVNSKDIYVEYKILCDEKLLQ